MTDSTTQHTYKALYHTFGCKLNFAETSAIARLMKDRGILRAAPGEAPDFIVVNTCSVTEAADRKCRQTIRSYHNRYPGAAILVTGCYAQLKSGEVASLGGVAVVAGIDKKLRLTEYVDGWLAERRQMVDVSAPGEIRDFMPSCSRGDRTRYFLKVQDGCDYWCTYCTIPKARGRSRSGTIGELVRMATEAAEAGGKEIVITGVNIGDFGKGRDDTFLDLIKALDEVRGIERYRISSIEPNLLTDEIISWCGSSRSFMPHFHIPLQCGSDSVLRLMHRHYDTALFRHKIERIRQLIPDAYIGVDLIVGARGETVQLFEESRAFVESLPISKLHVFPYSERPGTKALEIAHSVSGEEKRRRDRIMLSVSDRKLREFAGQFAGQVRPVLIEHPLRDGAVGGFTDNYLRVNIPGASGMAMDNTLVNVRLDSFDPDTMEFSGTITE